MKVAQSTLVKLELRVEYANGDEHDYVTNAMDQWRASKLVAIFVDGEFNPHAVQPLAWAAAVRSGHAYKQKRQSTDPVALFEQWLDDVTDIAVWGEEDDIPADADAPKADTTPPASPEE